MNSKKAEVRRQGGAPTKEPGRNSGGGVVRAERKSAIETRTKAETVVLMEAVVERGNLMLAYEQVMRNSNSH